ncbi:hypothetical protein CAOG_06197 [Capsaspora owczarzaki ATCC 30864]|nr:hypothetical protein CAOG_06197 [Capsaspora owczarzaki ATCC 30864]|eukprot:XP_004345787.1 hypothetical protein CAOG_06197 [Capsaspora owczarzaki ATCC 30864]
MVVRFEARSSDTSAPLLSREELFCTFMSPEKFAHHERLLEYCGLLRAVKLRGGVLLRAQPLDTWLDRMMGVLNGTLRRFRNTAHYMRAPMQVVSDSALLQDIPSEVFSQWDSRQICNFIAFATEKERRDLFFSETHPESLVDLFKQSDANVAPAASRRTNLPRSSAVAAAHRSSIPHKRRSAAPSSPPAGRESEGGHVDSRNAAIPQPQPHTTTAPAATAGPEADIAASTERDTPAATTAPEPRVQRILIKLSKLASPRLSAETGVQDGSSPEQTGNLQDAATRSTSSTMPAANPLLGANFWEAVPLATDDAQKTGDALDLSRTARPHKDAAEREQSLLARRRLETRRRQSYPIKRRKKRTLSSRKTVVLMNDNGDGRSHEDAAPAHASDHSSGEGESSEGDSDGYSSHDDSAIVGPSSEEDLDSEYASDLIPTVH